MKAPIAANKKLSPKLWRHNSKIIVEFKGSCLKQDKVTFTPTNVVNLFIAYDLVTWSRDLKADFTLKCCLSGAVNLNSVTADPDKYSYPEYGIGFGSNSLF